MKNFYQFNQKAINEIIKFLVEKDDKPNWLEINDIELELNGDILNIILQNIYYIQLDLSISQNHLDTFAIKGSGGFGYEDLEFVLSVMRDKNEIINILK